MIKKEEANENATIRHGEMVYVEPVQEIILIPNDRFESSWSTKVSPISLKSLPKKKVHNLYRGGSPQLFKLTFH